MSLAAFYLPFGLLALMLARLPWQRRWLKALTVELIAMAAVFAAIGVYQWVTRDVFWNPKVIVSNAYAPFFRVNSVFWDPSIYGRFLVVAIVVALVVVLYGVRRDWIVARVGVVALWVGLLFSFSQSSFVALVAGRRRGDRAVVAAALGRRARLRRRGAARGRVRRAVGARGDPRQHRPRDRQPLEARARGDAHRGRPPARRRRASAGSSARTASASASGRRTRRARPRTTRRSPWPRRRGFPGSCSFAWLVAAALWLPFRRASRSFAGRASLCFGLALVTILVHSLFYNAFFEDPMSWGLLGLTALGYAWRTSTRASRARSNGK